MSKRKDENYMGDPPSETTKYEDEAWEAGYLQGINHAIQIINDPQLKDLYKEMTRRFNVNSAARWDR